jgi:hypothetical protein
MPNGDRKDAWAALQLKHDHGATWDTGQVNGEWWAQRLDATAEIVGPVATPGELDDVLRALKERG